MEKTVSLLILILFLMFSCSDGNIKTPELNTKNETPEVLEEKLTDYSLSSVSKRFDSGIINKLFEEALEKNPKLKTVMDKIDDIPKIKKDSLESFHKYTENNNMYWSSADNQINLLSDTALREEFRNAFKILQESYNKRIENHNKAYDEISTRARILKDYEIMIKLVVTVPMINNYQRNELPDINTFNGLIENYDSLIIEAKPYTDINK